MLNRDRSKLGFDEEKDAPRTTNGEDEAVIDYVDDVEMEDADIDGMDEDGMNDALVNGKDGYRASQSASRAQSIIR